MFKCIKYDTSGFLRMFIYTSLNHHCIFFILI